MKRWQKWALCLVAGAIVLCVGCQTVTTRLVEREDRRVPRNPETGIMLGAEPFDLGPPPAEAQGAVLLVHGFAGATNNFGALPETLAAKGWHVRAMRLPGHGTSPLDMEKYTADELVNAVLAEVRQLRNDYKTVVLVGHSMGGALSVLAASKEPVDGLVLAGAYFGVTYRWYYVLPPKTWIQIGQPFMRWVYKGKLFLQVNRKEAKDEIVSYTWLPTKSFLMLLDIGNRASAQEVLSAITCPVLMLHAPGDAAASPDAAVEALGRMKSASTRTVWLDKSNHHIFWDFDRETVMNEIVRFLDELKTANPTISQLRTDE